MTPNPAEKVKAGLAEIRHFLLHTPTALTPVSVGPLLEQVTSDLAQLQFSSPPPTHQDLLEIQFLSARVQALYRSAASFFNGLAGESIIYSPQGNIADQSPQTCIEARG